MFDGLKKRGKIIRNIVIVLVALGLFYWLVLSTPINRLILQNQLTQATANWEARNITHYRIVFDLTIPMQILRTRFSIIVKNGQMEEVLSKPAIDLRYPNYNPDTAPYTSVSDDGIKLFHLSNRTVEGMYEFAASALDKSSPNDWFNFEFDAQYGYINQVNEICTISDCGFYYRVVEFEPIFGT